VSGGVNQPPVSPSAPAAAPNSATGGSNAADAYLRAVQARPTSFTENPIGRMASAVDKIGKAAGGVINTREAAGADPFAQGEARLREASEAARANPSTDSLKKQLGAALSLLHDMDSLPANDPRKVKLATFITKLANKLGPEGLSIAGMDSRGLLRLAAQITSRFGDAAAMQMAFQLEGLLKESLPQSSVEAVRLRDQLMQRFGISRGAAGMLTNTWAVRLAHAGEVPKLDMSARTLVLDAQQENPSLAVLARAYWHDTSLANPADKDGFVAAFLKVANQGSFAIVNRKYRELRRMARTELAGHAALAAPGQVAKRADDESADMFAAVAVFSKADGQSMPDDLRPALQRFYG
jgi:hypothetical protein